MEKTCLKCGAIINADARQGFCPKCLFVQASQKQEPDSQDQSDADLPRAFGEYELIREVARGGMGIVYEARQTSLNRIVAVKMLLFGPLASPEFVKRFRAEASAVAALSHPNIVGIHEVGVIQGQHYFVMDYVEGESLSKSLIDGPLPARRAARYAQIIAEAIHYAHERGILHRDLKPSNVLIDSNDQPRVTDFGLARRLEGDSELTLTGQVLGSPNYMPPEQAGARRGKLDRRSDVYSLGAMLYHLLTGRPPFGGEAIADTLDQVLNAQPVSPRLLQPSLPRDLETICLKCLEKDPGKRYATAFELAEELNRFSRSEPISARPVSAPEKVWRWCCRKPAFAGSLLLIIILFLIVIIGSPVALLRINRSRDQMEKLLYVANIGRAQAGWDENNAELVGRMLHETEGAPYHGFEWFYWQRQIHLAATTLHFPSNVIALSVSPDGRRLASGGGDALKLWDMSTGRRLREMVRLKGHTGSVFAVAFSPDGKRIISGGQDKTARIWEAETGREIQKIEGSGEIEAVAFSPDGRRVLTGGNDNTVKMWDLATGEVLLTLPGNPCAFSPDGRQILTGVNKANNNTAILWDAAGAHEISRFKGHADSILSLAFSPDGTRFLTGSRDLTAKVWDVSTSRELFTLGPHRHGLNSVAFSRDGQRVATGSVDQTVRVWNANDGQLLFTLRGHIAEIEGLAFFPDGRIVSSAQDSTIRFWDADGPRETLKLGGDNPQIWGIAFSPDGRRVVTGSYHGTAKMWDVQSRRELFQFNGTTIDLSSDGRKIVSGHGNVARLFDAETGQQIRKFEGHTGGLHSVAFSADGQRIVTAAIDRLAIIWDAASGKELLRLDRHAAPVRRAVFSPDGNRVLTVSNDQTARIWNSSSGAQSLCFTGHRNWVISCAFSPEGQRIATGDGDRTILFWEAATGRVIHTLKGHSSAVQSLVFSPDGRRILSSSEDGTARLWDSASGQEILVLKGHRGPIFRAVFSRDGRQIATGGRDGITQIWQSATPEQVMAWTEEEMRLE